MIARKIFYALSPVMRRRVRKWIYAPLDMWDKLTGNTIDMVPPRGMIFTGSGDFIASGNVIKTICIEQGGLKPDGKILDIGCGIGRLARALTGYLTHGQYEGFDVVEDGIVWCKSHIQPRFPQFNFTYTPLRNDLYNLDTQQQAKEFIFPYPDNQFDVVILTSVFTHMQPEEVAHYLFEINRVLKPGGRCVATYFIMNSKTEVALHQNKKLMQFPYAYEGYYLHDNNVKDANIAFDEQRLTRLMVKAGFQSHEWHWGWWRGLKKNDCLNFQDVVIATKPQ
ncbi:MAG: class I SAM-dependent methyltransferase [Bacteroidia bacterium]|jgi:ubiquinone/menaquinone biosynthesis C-methylase UbiE|nr:class I SAM-dependent methyltransferase [Bacteroidia bacterium]